MHRARTFFLIFILYYNMMIFMWNQNTKLNMNLEILYESGTYIEPEISWNKSATTISRLLGRISISQYVYLKTL